MLLVPWKKSPPEIIAAFEEAKPHDPAVQSRPMFGYPSVFLNGNHFAGTFQEKIVVRFGDDLAIPGAGNAKAFEPMPGRAMTGYVVVPDEVVKSPPKLRAWIAHAHDHAKKLPAKAAKPSRGKSSSRAKSSTAAKSSRGAKKRV